MSIKLQEHSGLIGLLFRYYFAEMPYIDAFISHYKKLGICSFCAIVQNVEDGEYLSNVMKRYDIANFSYHFISDCDPDSALKKINFKTLGCKTEFLLHVDIDELLILPNELSEETFSVDSFFIPWVILCNTDNSIPKKTGSYINIFKHMARTSLISGFKNPHEFIVSKLSRKGLPLVHLTQENCFSKNIYIVHHWSRSFSDVLIKITLQMFTKSFKNDDVSSNNPHNSLQVFLENREIPKRLRYLAYLDTISGDVDITLSNHQDLYNLEEERRLISLSCSTNQFVEIHKLFVEYRSFVSVNKHLFPFWPHKISIGKVCLQLPALNTLRNAA